MSNISDRMAFMVTKGEQTRDFIVEKSYALFVRKGFKQVTMKDVCEITGMSRGGLYSHFSSTGEIFEAILKEMTQKDDLDFQREIKKGIPAVTIMDNALSLLEKEMNDSETSLSEAIYEYSETVDSNVMTELNQISVKKWSALIRYGIKTGEFNNVDVTEIVSLLLYSYQGIRMWSRIIPVSDKTIRSIVMNIKKQLYKK